jgi:hypothetical protein
VNRPRSFARIVGCTVATFAAGRQRDRDGGTRRLRDEIAPMHTRPDVSADRRRSETRLSGSDGARQGCPRCARRFAAFPHDALPTSWHFIGASAWSRRTSIRPELFGQ